MGKMATRQRRYASIPLVGDEVEVEVEVEVVVDSTRLGEGG